MPPNGRKRQKPDQKVIKEIIHSGHFMVSDIDDSEIQDGEDGPSLVVHESDCDQENISIPVRAFDFESACKETSKTYHFGARSSHSISIDASLTKLFECMTLAYSGKLTSPRWKQFKGLKLRLKEKIRLNNMIWRAWHMQFVMKIKTFVCQFATPLEGEMHSKPEAVVIEGTYWKRRMANITAEYKKWRLFYKDKFRLKPSHEAGNMAMDLDMRWPSWSKDSFSSLQNAVDEDFIMDFSDTLFSTFNPGQPFDFPNPREIAARAGIADFIQPGLVQFQPTVDDFMDTFEPLQDLLTDFLNSRLPSLPEEVSNSDDMMSSSDPQSLMNSNYRAFDGNTSSNLSSQTNLHSPFMSMKRNIGSKKQNVQRTLQQSNISQFSGKPMLDIMNSNANTVLPESSLNTVNQASVQPFIGNEIPPSVQPSEDNTVRSVLQSNVQSSKMNSFRKVNSLEISDSSRTIDNSMLMHNNMKSRSDSFLQKPAFLSRSFDETSLSHQNTLIQTTHKIQVPMETIPQGHVSSNIMTSGDPKVQQDSFLFSLNSGQFNKGSLTNDNFLVPVQVSNVSSPTESKFLTTSLMKESAPQNSVVRRHSYTTGQPLQTPIVNADYMGTRKSRAIAPVVAPASFIVPESPARQRTRSRSVSSPQAAKPKPAIQQPSQASSLTDVSSSFHSAALLQDTCYKKSVMASNDSSILVNATSHIAATNVLPQNAVLAQLLSGHNQDVIKVTSSATTACTTPVTIIRPALVSTAAHTLVFSPIPIATAAGVSDFQRSLLVSAANHVFGTSNSPPSILPSQSPDSTGSSTCSSSPAISSVAFDPNSPISKTVRLKSDEERIQYKEHRRVCHINAEQKRRCNIKNGFESLHNLLPPYGQSSNSKVSKAAMLQRGADYIRTLKTERQQQKDEAELLKKQIDELNQTIGLYQSQLPASGAPVSCQKTNRMKEMFEDYVRQETLQNWKFWIFSLILEPLVESYNSSVSTANIDEMCKTILTWLDQHCSLVALRPGVLNSLRHLSTTTNILSDPSQMPEEATRAVTKKEKKQ